MEFGNANKLIFVWKIINSKIRTTIRTISWSPHTVRNLLVSRGGHLYVRTPEKVASSQKYFTVKF
jgi:hypothetical protein